MRPQIQSWTFHHPSMSIHQLGLIPFWMDEEDPRPLSEQFNAKYPFGGWDPFPGFKMDGRNRLRYPGDPPMEPLASCQFRDELILFYRSSWVAIRQQDGTFEVCRMD